MKPLVVLVQPLTNILDHAKSLPTLPLALLAAARRVAPYCELRLVDARAPQPWRPILRELLDRRPLCVGVTSVTGNQILSTLEITRFVKAHGDTPVIWGGVHGTLFPDQVLSEPTVDYVVRGEGEDTFKEIVDALIAGREPGGLAGLSYRSPAGPVHEPDRPFLDMETLEEVPYYVMGSDIHFLSQGRPTLYMETSRGCRCACTYCYVSSFHKRKWRGQSAQTVLDRLDRIRTDYPHIRHLSIVDDNFFGKVERTRQLARGLIERGSPFTYQVQGAQIQVLARIDDETLELLRQSGCERLDMGLESGSEIVRQAIRKKIDMTGLRRMNRTLGRLGIMPWYNVMAGFPGETDQDIRQTTDLILDLQRDNPQALFSPVYRVVPYPGTELYEQARAAGFAEPSSIEDWREYHGEGLDVPWQTLPRKRRISRLFFLTLFLDRKSEMYDTSVVYRFLARLYRPIARLRLRRHFLAAMPEYWVFRRLFNAS